MDNKIPKNKPYRRSWDWSEMIELNGEEVFEKDIIEIKYPDGTVKAYEAILDCYEVPESDHGKTYYTPASDVFIKEKLFGSVVKINIMDLKDCEIKKLNTSERGF